MKAFPSEYTETKGGNKFGPHKVTITNTGMDLRDYFAAKAMQAMLSWEDVGNFNVSEEAYMMADAMMKAREQ